MKKYLIAGALALICNGMMTSCSEDMDNYASLEEAKKAQFAQNFEKFFGKPDPNQDWGFNDDAVATARTRTVVKADMTNFPNDMKPDPVTAKEAEWVTKWFQKNPGLSEKGKDWSNFYLQYVSGSSNNKKGLWHRYDQNRTNNNYWDEEFTTDAVMNYLILTDSTSYKEHVNDFNANGGGPWGMVYMENSSALYFGYHSSWDSNDYSFFKLKELTVPGDCFDDGKARTGYYVGLSLYGKKYDNGDKELGIQRLQYADDWILKVVPGEVLKKKEVLVHKWVFGEDLGNSSDHADFDYNDIVFDAKLIKETTVIRDKNGNEKEYGNDGYKIYAEVTPLAAGGELLITFNENGTSLHDFFTGHPAKNVLINTQKEGEETVMNHKEKLTAETFKYEFGNEDPNIKNISVIVRTTSGSAYAIYELSAAMGDIPHKLCVPPGTRWPYERHAIDAAYPGFLDYAKNNGPEPWKTNVNEGDLYPIDGLSDYLTNDKKDSVFYVPVDESSEPIDNEYSLIDTNYENELWIGTANFAWNSGDVVDISASALKSANVGNGTKIRIYGKASEWFSIKANYISTWDDNLDLGNETWIQTYNGTVDKCNYSAAQVNGCVELVLNATTAANFKEYGMRLYGDKFKALCITYDNSKKVLDEEPDTPNQEDDVQIIDIWTGSNDVNNNWATIYNGNGNKFNDAKPGDCIRITAQIMPNTGWWQFNLNNTSWEEICGYIKNETSGQTLSSLGYQDIELNQSAIDRLKKGGLMSYKSNLIFTKVQLVKK